MKQSSDSTFISQPAMCSITLWVSHIHNADATSRNTTRYDKHQHSVSHGHENHFHHESVTVSQMLDDFMLAEVRRPVLRRPRGHGHNKAQMNDRVTLTGNKWLLKWQITSSSAGSCMGGFSNSPGGSETDDGNQFRKLSISFYIKGLNLERTVFVVSCHSRKGWTGSLPTQHNICHYCSYRHAITPTAANKGGLNDFAQSLHYCWPLSKESCFWSLDSPKTTFSTPVPCR